jgi:hypothetical protein
VIGFERRHIVIRVPFEIYPEMKAEYEQLTDNRDISVAWYRGRSLVKTVLIKNGQMKRSCPRSRIVYLELS